MARSNEPNELFIANLLGGLNTRGFNQKIADNQISDGVLNTRIYEDGVLGKRLGVAFYGTVGSLASTSYCGGLGVFYTSSAKTLLADFGPYLTKYSSSMFTPVSGATFTVNSDKNFVTARGTLYIHNGVDMLTTFDGTALSRLTGSATTASAGASVTAGGVVASWGLFFKTSHLAGGNPIFTNRVFVSQAGNSSNFVLANVDGNSTDQAQWYDVAKDDGDQLTGVASSGDSAILFKERATYQGTFNTAISSQTGGVTSSNNFFTSILPLNKGIGAVSHRSIDNMENDIVFFSRNGPAIYTIGYQPNLTGLRFAEISQPVKNLLEGISQGNLAKCSGIYWNKRYYLSIPYGAASIPNRVLVFNREYGVWEGFYEGLNVNSFTTFIDPNDTNTEKLLMADGNTPRVGAMDQTSYTDFSSAINTDVYFKNYDLGAPSRYKRWLDLTLFFRSTNATSITVSIYIDGTLKRTKTFSVGSPTSSVGIGAGLIGQQTIGDAGNGSSNMQVTTTDRRIKINAKGRTCQIRVQNNTAGEVFNIPSLEFTYRNSYGHSAYPSTNKIS